MKTPQVPALPGMTPLGINPRRKHPVEHIERCVHHYVPFDDGRTVALFVNRDTGLVVLDIVDANEQGGVEVYRAYHE